MDSIVQARHARGDRSMGWFWLLALLAAAPGCGTTRVTDTARTATEQLLVSQAVDKAITEIDSRALAGKPVFFDAQYIEANPDRGYLVSSLRQHLLANGCHLVEDRAKATYIVEARSGGLGTDRHQVLIGVPQMNLPGVMPGQPSLIPEIPLAKKTDQKGVAKIAVFAYNRQTGLPVWQSGVVQEFSTSKDTWLFGAGPFRKGTLGESTSIAGKDVAIPLLSGKDENQIPRTLPGIGVTQAAVWTEAPPASTQGASEPNPIKPVSTPLDKAPPPVTRASWPAPAKPHAVEGDYLLPANGWQSLPPLEGNR